MLMQKIIHEEGKENDYILIALYSQLLIIYVNGIEMVITIISIICISVCISVLFLTWIYLWEFSVNKERSFSRKRKSHPLSQDLSQLYFSSFPLGDVRTQYLEWALALG